MTTEEVIISKLRSLPPDKQQDVLAFVESLDAKGKKPLKSPEGLWSDLGFTVSDAEIAEARQEMWATFPRCDI
jgi:hypothetical protein